MFVKGKSYIRREIHQRYGGQEQGGISTPAGYPIIFLFTGKQGEQYGYRDGWTKQGIFLFSGIGRYGDMTFSRGNKALRDHIQDGKDVYLFEYIDPGIVRFVDQMLCIGYELRVSQDAENKLRRAIVFRLVSLRAFSPDIHEDDAILAAFDDMAFEELRQLAIEANEEPDLTVHPHRPAAYPGAALRAYIHRRASGFCEGCNEEAPFYTDSDRPYLEVHYIRRPSDVGAEHPVWAAALCPNCHRRAHAAHDSDAFNAELHESIRQKEKSV